MAEFAPHRTYFPRNILCLFMWSPFSIRAQTTLSGTVRDLATRKPLGSANVMLQDTARRLMYGYAITNADGGYTLTGPVKAEMLLGAGYRPWMWNIGLTLRNALIYKVPVINIDFIPVLT